MSKRLNHIFFSLSFLLLITSEGTAQMANWQYASELRIAEQRGVTHSNYIAVIFPNLADLIQNGKLNADASDLRFTDSCGTQILKHWVAGDLQNNNTEVFIETGALSAGAQKSILMFYGNPSATTNQDSSFLISNSWISNGNQQINTTQIDVDYFELRTTDTLYLLPGSPLTINSRFIKINGVINGNGCGANPLQSATCGYGPNGGGMEGSVPTLAIGGSGGGYGGNGGIGESCSGSNVNPQGQQGGSISGPDICMGRKGGGNTTNPGGLGGGCLLINTEVIDLKGKILMSGQNGSTNTDFSLLSFSGGGSGGGIQINCQSEINNTGTLEAKGGNGGYRTVTVLAHASGGGGAGGRIKIFTELNYSSTTPTVNTDGGTSQPKCTGSGTQLPGEPGSFYHGYSNFNSDTVIIGEEVNLRNTLISPNPDYICQSDSLQILTPLQISHSEILINNIQHTVSGNNFYLNNLNNGDTITLRAYIGNSCFYQDTTFIVTVYNSPAVTLSSPYDSICHNWGDIQLYPSPIGGIYSGAVISNNTFITQANPPQQYLISYQYTDSNFCSATDTLIIEVLACTDLSPIQHTTDLNIIQSENNWVEIINNTSSSIDLVIVSPLGQQIVSFQAASGITRYWTGHLKKGIYFIYHPKSVYKKTHKLLLQ